MSLQTRRVCVLGVLFFLKLLSNDAAAQVSFALATLTHADPVPGTPLIIQAVLNDPTPYSRIYFRYRVFSSSEFSTLEMDLTGSQAAARIPAEHIRPPFIEYYLIFVRTDGEFETHPPGPAGDPFASPPGGTLQIQVRDPGNQSGVIFLSPETAGRLDPDEVVIAASLLRADSAIVRSATKIWLDGIDVTDQAVFTGDLLVFVPDNAGMVLGGGRHTVSDRSGVP
jgi:hypothetical protein